MKSDYTRYDDERLIRLITEAQEEALAQLYDRYNRLVFSLAVAIVNDRATAEEITLDVFMRVWQKAGTYCAAGLSGQINTRSNGKKMFILSPLSRTRRNRQSCPCAANVSMPRSTNCLPIKNRRSCWPILGA